MTEHTKQPESGPARNGSERAWERPELKEHGELRELTAGSPFGPGDLLGTDGIPSSQG